MLNPLACFPEVLCILAIVPEKSDYRNVALGPQPANSHIPISPFIRPYPVQVADYFRLARDSPAVRPQAPMEFPISRGSWLAVEEDYCVST